MSVVRKVYTNSKRGKQVRRRYSIQTNYGITLEDEIKLKELQDNKCAICETELVEGRTALDHDHSCCTSQRTCGKCTRGFLCTSCNVGLGMFKDSIPKLIGAIRYLESNGVGFQSESNDLSFELLDLSYDLV